MAAELRRIPFHTALSRPDLLFGCERQLILVIGLVCLVLVVVVLTKLAVVLGILTWFGAVAALRAMAKADPVLSKVYLRHVRYRAYYPAHATLFAPPARYVRNR